MTGEASRFEPQTGMTKAGRGTIDEPWPPIRDCRNPTSTLQGLGGIELATTRSQLWP